MSDRELLEMAAKAEGRNLSGYEWYETPSNPNERGFICYAGDGTHIWNPLRMDDDCFRLAYKSGVDICFFDRYDTIEEFRRAIVEAVAKIGERMINA